MLPIGKSYWLPKFKIHIRLLSNQQASLFSFYLYLSFLSSEPPLPLTLNQCPLLTPDPYSSIFLSFQCRFYPANFSQVSIN